MKQCLFHFKHCIFYFRGFQNFSFQNEILIAFVLKVRFKTPQFHIRVKPSGSWRRTTILEKSLRHFVWFRRKRNPFPQRNVDPSHVVRSLVGSLNIDWWGRGRIMISSRTCAFYWTMSCSIFYFSGKHGDSCNKLHQVYQLFFPGL